ncbi:hypothetical protein ABC418_17210 [Lactiplantibacillus plantarum]
MNEVVIKGNKLFIDGVEVKGIINRMIEQKPGRDTVTITFHAKVLI